MEMTGPRLSHPLMASEAMQGNPGPLSALFSIG